MRFRRITQYLRDHNWFAVGIDFVIVVVGVFLAAQIANWDQSAKQQRLYEESFDRAIVETQRNLQSLETTRSEASERLPIVQLALEDLRACKTGDDVRAHVEAAFAPVGTAPQFDFDTKALDQLINNDSFLPFQSEETRRLLMDLSARMNRLSRSSIYIGASLPENRSRAAQPGPLLMKGPDEIVAALKQGGIPSGQMVRESKLAVPLAEACKDEELLREFYGWEDLAYFHIVMGQLAAERLRSNLNALGRPAAVDETGN